MFGKRHTRIVAANTNHMQRDTKTGLRKIIMKFWSSFDQNKSLDWEAKTDFPPASFEAGGERIKITGNFYRIILKLKI